MIIVHPVFSLWFFSDSAIVLTLLQRAENRKNVLTCVCCRLFHMLLFFLYLYFFSFRIYCLFFMCSEVKFCSIVLVSDHSVTGRHTYISLLSLFLCPFWIGLSRTTLKRTFFTGVGKWEKYLFPKIVVLRVHRLSMVHECVTIFKADFLFPRLHILNGIYISIGLW